MSSNPASSSLPHVLQVQLNAALEVLRLRLRISRTEATSHLVCHVEGWSDDQETIDAIATYLIALLTSAISRALHVRAQIENTSADRLELVRSVETIVGSAGQALSRDKKEDERNPWIAEGMWHLCLFLSSQRDEFHPPGVVIALDLPHVAAKDHGFDVVGLYRNGAEFGVSFVETKAYETNPNKAIASATTFYEELDDGKHDLRARQAVASLRDVLSPADQKLISSSLWKQTRSYLPNPHYDASAAPDWTRRRSVFAKLRVPRERIIIMPHQVQDFAKFFDDVGDAMRKVVVSLPSV